MTTLSDYTEQRERKRERGRSYSIQSIKFLIESIKFLIEREEEREKMSRKKERGRS